MTADELERLKELESKATKGPWTATKTGSVWTGPLKLDDPGITRAASMESHHLFEIDQYDYDFLDEDEAEIQVRDDMALIAALRNAAPALIALAEWAERAKAEIEYALHPGVFGPYKTTDDPQFADGKLLEMCKRCGFGAVMHTVQHLWKIHGPHRGAEHTCAAAADVRDGWIDRTQKLLAAYPEGE